MNLKSVIFLLSLVAQLFFLNFIVTAQSKTYAIDQAESNIHVIVFKAGLLRGLTNDHDMGVKSFTGNITIISGGADGGSISLDVDARSLVVLDKGISEGVRKKVHGAMHNNTLQSAKYDKINFKSASVSNKKKTGGNSYNFDLIGDLSLHGVTKRITVPISLVVTPQQVRATGKYTLKQTDYGMKPFSTALGTIKVKNEVVIHFDAVAKS